MSGTPLICVEKDKFKFDTDLSDVEWKVRYSNSVCLKRDQALQDLLTYYSCSSSAPEISAFWSRSLGFCAFAMLKGVPLVGFESQTKKFFFGSHVDFDSLQVDYLNSDCSTHDSEVNRLRSLGNTY